MNMEENETKHLEWIFDRLECVYGENPNTDYMIKFRQIIDKLIKRRELKDAIMPELIPTSDKSER